MSQPWKWIKKLTILIICTVFVFLVLWANGRISIPWRTGTLDSFYDIEQNQIASGFFLSRSNEGYTFLMQRDAEKLTDYLFSMQMRSKFWQHDILSSDVQAEISLHDGSNTRVVINIVGENMIEVDSHVYTIQDGVDFDYIVTCFDGAEDHSYLYNGTTGEE